MTTLAQILAVKEKILELVDAFGFLRDDIQIYRDMLSDYNSLNIVVKQIPKASISYKAIGNLEAMLINELNCNVTVTDYDGIDPTSLDQYDKYSKSFSDIKGLCHLFGVDSLHNVIFSGFDDSGEYLTTQPEILELAQKYLEKKNNIPMETSRDQYLVNNNPFWQQGNSPTQSAVEQESLEAKVLACLQSDTNLWHSLEQSPQAWDTASEKVKQAISLANKNYPVGAK